MLTHHKKLGCWLQPGGHADGDSDVAAVSLREAEEESGLESDYSEILNEEEVVDFNDDEVDFLQNTLSHSDEEGTALSDSEMLF